MRRGRIVAGSWHGELLHLLIDKNDKEDVKYCEGGWGKRVRGEGKEPAGRLHVKTVFSALFCFPRWSLALAVTCEHFFLQFPTRSVSRRCRRKCRSKGCSKTERS